MLNYRSVLYILGMMLSKVALLMYVPLLYALLTGTGGVYEFLQAVIITHLIALFLIAQGRSQKFYLRIRDMFLTTTLAWLTACCFGALPFVFIKHITFTDAFFETMSGLTTTGSSVLSNLNQMEPSVLLWRSLLQWMGGVGFIVMAVAILPFLDVGGMRLFHTESSDWSEKSSPRMKDVAKSIMAVYAVLTFLCYLGYRYAGMSNFDAVNHAFATISTGGFSTNDKSMAAYSVLAQWNAILFMFLGSLPFLLFVQALRQRSLRTLMRDQQLVGFSRFVLVVGLILTLWLWHKHIFDFEDSLRIAFFNLINILSTTGYSLGNFDQWTPFTTVLFASLMLLGGCSGSTAGGIKMFRVQIGFESLHIEVRKLIHPNAVFPRRYNNRPITNEVSRSVIAFMMAFIAITMLIAAILGLCGVDALSSITGAMSAMANVGPGMGPLIGPSGNFAPLPDVAKWALSLGMLLGRLEVMTMLVLFFPSFWRH
ncbi:TrkH family potassium uptake protein [Edwardsiella ictaluri]|uniref:Trk system potassium uptake protein n=1 Tax=Edwardsiella ictaluri (strain 93-146) TaxID=634503 RepID=C5BF21_EDWI9|nr:TrkH family potassium uptake protein [Edwardsiella ictaluri]ACR70693.1 potassium uptake protein, TrkH family [Edwardsiella ictaluri 93-146]AVZ82508.1 TrkH family potassium uptake protein [Edwardsiella ictaluri]EKS7764460.1 TrkH family potassium uptake protein [Edwardsiella ictaluri]EKS7771380.1 TrkH family potassium uptake protein [Edwardsiella ictaluri]EKS7774496.1 TrkH family potassium uptake protein [Edwardsiella ictaluri]